MPSLKSKSWIKIQQIARMRVLSIPDTEICRTFGLTRSGLSRIYALPHYQELEKLLLAGQVTQMDKILAGRTEEIRQQFEILVPMAMRTMLDAVAQRRDLKTALSAAGEILDRDPNLTYSKKKETGLGPGNGLPIGILNNAAKAGDEASLGMSIPAKGKPN